MINVSPLSDPPPSSAAVKARDVALIEAVRNVDVIHTSLAGMTAIVVMLLVAVAMPVYGFHPVTQPLAFWIMAAAAFIGIVGLYILNFRIHQHVTHQASMTEALVNSLGQGFVFFGGDGICSGVYSQACLELLETVPLGKPVSEVLGVPEDKREDIQDWISVLFQPDHALSFEDVVRFLPHHFAHSKDKKIVLDYKPVNDTTGKLVRVVVIATDQTEEYLARAAAKRQQNFADMVCRIFKDRNQFQAMLDHIHEFLDDADKTDITPAEMTVLLRQLHTLKASVKQFSLLDFAEIIHSVENELRDPTATVEGKLGERLAVARQKIADALAQVTEEVSSLIGSEYQWRGNVREFSEDDIYEFARIIRDRAAPPEIIELYLKTIAAVPIRDCFRSFEREVRELASMMEKQVKPVQFLGSNPRVLTQPLQELLFSFTHICRNIMDHGIESPVTRMARGKDAAGQISVTSDVVPTPIGDGYCLKIVIADDGNGIDPSRVRAKLSGIDPEGVWRFEDDQTVIQRIFSWGFTTSDTVTALSGRGVGMEAVEREVKALGGTVRVESQLYRGTTFTIEIPYELDITKVDLTPPEKKGE